jgi:hypothetical protein
VIRADRPAERPDVPGPCRGDPTPEPGLLGLSPVDECDQLEVRAAERHDPVRRAPAEVAASLDRRQAVLRLELTSGDRKIGHGDHDMVELQTGKPSTVRA